MNDKNTHGNILHRITPKGVPGWIALLFMLILAFSIGIMSNGVDNSSNEETHVHSAEESSEPSVWTCSMHPQIKLPKSGKCPICFMDLIPLETGSGEELDPRQIRISKSAKELAQIQSTPVRRGHAEAEIRMVGKIAYDESKVNEITAWVPGRIDSLYVNFTGITVHKGDKMVNMYSPELYAAQEELLQAKKAIQALEKTKSKILKSTAEQTLISSREKLRLFGLTDIQISEFENTEKANDHLIIYAPIGGVVLHKNVKEGMYVQTGTQLYTIADLSQLWIYFEAYESDIPWLRKGQRVEFQSRSFPGEIFEATISFIDPVVDSKKRTVKVRAIVKNVDNNLKPDMFVSGVVKSKLDLNGIVLNKNSDNVAPLLIPITAPMITGKRAVVYVEIPNEEEPLFEGREVVLGPKAGDFYIVKSGLAEGELIVVNGAFKIDAELQIQAKPSMMSPKGGTAPIVHNHDEMTSSNHIELKEIISHSSSTKTLDALTPLYNSYFEIQMALANDDFVSTSKAFTDINKVVKKIDMSIFEGDAHTQWMNISQAVSDASQGGIKANSITESRNAFLPLSKAIIELENSFGHSDNKNYYLTYCPMAIDNKGAHWLQTVDTVYNSFYGDMMLRCGEIQKTFSSTSRNKE